MGGGLRSFPKLSNIFCYEEEGRSERRSKGEGLKFFSKFTLFTTQFRLRVLERRNELDFLKIVGIE